MDNRTSIKRFLAGLLVVCLFFTMLGGISVARANETGEGSNTGATGSTQPTGNTQETTPQDDPGDGDNADDPGDGGNADDPGNGGNADDPGNGGNADDPGNGGNADDPGNGGNADDPGNGGNADDPGNGGNADDPGNGGNADDPGNGGNADDPGNGGNADDPGNGGNTENPNNGSKNPPLTSPGPGETGVPFSGDGETGISFSAGVYEDADRQVLLSEMTAEGSSLAGWEYYASSNSTADRYLGVVLSGLPMEGAQYRLIVEMDPVIYINQNSDPNLPGTTVSFTRNANLVVNTDGSYTPKTYSLSNLTYLIDSGTRGLTLGLPLRYDVNLWNKRDGGALGNGTDPLIRVYLQEAQADGTFVTVENCDVNLLQATTSGKVPLSVSHSCYIVGGSETATSNMGGDDSLRMLFSRFNNTTFSGGHLDKNVEVKITLPSCTVNGTKYTMSYENFRFSTSGGTSAFQTDYDPDTGVVTFSAENFYFNSDHLFRIDFLAPEGLKSIPGNYVLNGNITVVADGVTIASNRGIQINLDTNTKAILKTFRAYGSANCVDLDTVQPFGNLALRNDAAAGNGSGPLLVSLTFDSNETNAVSVVAVNLMCDRETQYIDIAYTLVDGEGNPAYPDPVTGENQVFTTTVKNSQYKPGGTIGNNTYQTFTRVNLPVAEHRQYFFKTVSYTIGDLPGNSKAYHSGATIAPYSAGTIWGYVNVDHVPSVKSTHSMKVYQRNGDGTLTDLNLNATTTSDINAGIDVPYGLEKGEVSDTAVMAGDSVTIGGRIFVAGYPYTSNNCLNDIRLGFVLPVGITVNAASITTSYAGGSLAVKQVTSSPINAEKNLWLVEFEPGNKIGYYNEKLSSLSNGSTLTFTVQLNSEKTMSTQTVFLRESVFAAGLNRNNGSGGTYGDHAVKDTYDLNGNGLTSDKVACFGTETTESVTFQMPPAELAITNEMVDSDGNTGAAVELKSFADTVNYNLRVECTEGGSADEFFYIIPVGRTGMQKDSEFVDLSQVDLKMKGPAVVTNQNGTALKVLYSTTPATGYNAALALTDWSETLPEGKTWEDVTMLKVVAAEDVIINGSVDIISVPLGYDGEDTEYEKLAGMKVRWSSRGYYNYHLGYNNNAGTQSTENCTVTLTYTPQEPIRFTLTAAKDGQPQGAGAVNTYSFELPQFVLAQEYSIKQITPYNVKLMDENYDFSTASSAEANENFRINISVKNSASDATGTTPVAIEKDGTIVGSLPGNTAPEFTFTLDNADALSDIVTERYVTLTLVGNNGVIVPVVVTIKRELAAAEPTESAIVAGPLYAPFEGPNETTVSSDSAFTAQFVTAYIPGNYTDRTLEFDAAPVSGTKVMMIDWTDSSNVKYYHLTLDGSTTSVKLTQFAGMGSSADYLEPTDTAMVTERLLFVVSFPIGGEALRTNSMTLTKQIKTGTDDTVPAELTFTTVAKREFSLTPQSQSAAMDENFTLSYTSGCSVTDSRYTGRFLSLVIRSANDMALPADAVLRVGAQEYTLNSDGLFIVPLKAAQAGNGSITAQFHSATVDSAALKAELWASATANGSDPMMGTLEAGPVSIQITGVTLPSFKVTNMSARLLHKEDLSGVVMVEFAVMDATQITVEIQKKAGADYVTQTTVLESVNGKTAADAGQGVFYVDINPISIGISPNAAEGTYRLLFRIYNDNGSIEVPYNFIIAE